MDFSNLGDRTDPNLGVYPDCGMAFHDHYRLLDAYDAGGMGRVYKAHNEEESALLKREVICAIKVLAPSLVNDKRANERLKIEGALAKSLNNEHIVRIYNFDSDDKWTYIHMEWLEGMTLDKVLTQHKAQHDTGLPLAQIQSYLQALSSALSYAHGENVIHRDIKPSNIFLTDNGRIVLIDFGISYEARESLSRLTGIPNSGTAPYMSPQALKVAGHKPTIQDDIYSLATTTYELLCGHPPFTVNVCHYRKDDSDMPAKPPALNHQQWQVLQSALAYEADKRPPSVKAFVDAFCGLSAEAEQIEDLKKRLAQAEAQLEMKEAQEQAQREAEAQAKREAQAKAKREAEAKAKREAQAKAKREAEAKAKREAEAKAKREAKAQTSEEIAQRLWAWADEFNIPAEVIPRNKSQLLALQRLELGRCNRIYRPSDGVSVINPYKYLPQITYLPREIGQLSQLQDLGVSCNKLSALPAEIGQLSQLRWLNVSNNQLSTLPAEIGQLSQLRTLWVWENQLRTLPAEIGQLSQLQALDVHYNQLSALPAEIGQLRQLRELWVYNNQLRTLPASITHLTKLLRLELRNNPRLRLTAQQKFFDIKLFVIWKILTDDDTKILVGVLFFLALIIGLYLFFYF